MSILTTYFFLILTVATAIMLLLPYAFGAIWYPTPTTIIQRMIDLSCTANHDLAVDLGCGDGRILTEFAHRTGCRGIGVEINPLLVIISKIMLRLYRQQNRVRVCWGDMYRFDISSADVVFVYLSHKAMDRLQPKVVEELKPGACLISHGFLFKDWTPVTVDMNHQIFVYRKELEPHVIHADNNLSRRCVEKESQSL